MPLAADHAITDRPVMTVADDFPAGFIVPPHSHRHAQFCYAASGVLSVVTETHSFILPPRRAIWLPSGQVHQLACRSAVRLHVLYIDPKVGNHAGDCRVFDTSRLVRALIDEILACKELDRKVRMLDLLLDEINRMPDIATCAPMPEDERILEVCNHILTDPADTRDLDEWAAHTGLSRRTFTRVFKQETGMGLAAWRQQVRLMEALCRLHAGHSITTVAGDVGYDSPSAFTATFHRHYGMPPRQFLEE